MAAHQRNARAAAATGDGARPGRSIPVIAAVLCWVPLLALIAVTVVTWPLMAGEIATQWSGEVVATRAPGWTVLLPATGTIVCGVVGTVVAVERPRRDHRVTFAFCGAVGAVLLGVVVAVVLANLASG